MTTFSDRFSAHEPCLSQYRFPVAATQIIFRKKTWNEPKIVLPLPSQTSCNGE